MIVIGIDPHKGSHSACAVDARREVCSVLRVEASASGYRELLHWARAWPERRWAIEGARGLGRHLAQSLLARGETVVDVPSTLSARVRELTRAERKTDGLDALATATAAIDGEPRPVALEDASSAIGLVVERRDEVVRQRTRSANQLHALLLHLVAGGAKTDLSTRQAGALLRRVRPTDLVGRQRKAVARDLVADLRRLDAQLRDLDRRIGELVTLHGSSLPNLPGIGPILAARIIAHTGDVTRFPSAAHFASYAGTAPVEVASGDYSRHRLSRAGDRQLNCALHLVALEQRRHGIGGGDVYFARKLADGKSPREAMRCLKRRLSDRVYRVMLSDARRCMGSPPVT